LWDGGEYCVSELMDRLNLSQSRMSRHMQSLKAARLVTGRRDAQWVRYRLNPGLPPERRTLLDPVISACMAEAEQMAISPEGELR
jgi:ArsR family transcriptional regulator, arsenate/arsenite/antimonite-responsive transcriptional repressor